MFNRRVIWVGAMIVASIFAPTASTAQARAATEAQVERTANVKLSARQQAAYQEFIASRSYYGAFFVGKRGAVGAIQNVNTHEAARVVAKLRCQAGGDTCQEYALSSPKVKEGRVSFFEGIAMREAQKSVNWVRKHARGSNSAVMAASGFRGYSLWQDPSGFRGIDGRAKRDCRRRAQSWKSGLPAEEFAALENAGLIDCSIIFLKRG